MIYDRFYDTSEKTLYFQCFWPFFRGFKSRLAHQNPESFGSRGFFCLQQKSAGLCSEIGAGFFTHRST